MVRVLAEMYACISAPRTPAALDILSCSTRHRQHTIYIVRKWYRVVNKLRCSKGKNDFNA